MEDLWGFNHAVVMHTLQVIAGFFLYPQNISALTTRPLSDLSRQNFQPCLDHGLAATGLPGMTTPKSMAIFLLRRTSFVHYCSSSPLKNYQEPSSGILAFAPRSRSMRCNSVHIGRTNRTHATGS
jgi:hypothetical protein